MIGQVLQLCTKRQSQICLIKNLLNQANNVRNASLRNSKTCILLRSNKRWFSTSQRPLNQKVEVKKVQKKSEDKPPKGIPYKNLTIGVPKESWQNEKRVALSPAVVSQLVKRGFKVIVEDNAGALATFRNEDYTNAGATIVNQSDVFSADIVVKVRQPIKDEVDLLKNNSTLISFLYPAQNKDIIDAMAKKNITAFGMDCVPRISRAQVYDALSSMANISGYRAVVEAANYFPRFFSGKLFFLIILRLFHNKTQIRM